MNDEQPSVWLVVRGRKGKRLFDYDPVRNLVRIGERRETEVIDLDAYRKPSLKSKPVTKP